MTTPSALATFDGPLSPPTRSNTPRESNILLGARSNASPVPRSNESAMDQASQNSHYFGSQATFELPPITKMEGAITDEEFTGAPLDVKVSLPTFEAYHYFRSNQELIDRRFEALRIGSQYLDKYFLHNTSKVFSRRLLKDIFHYESAQLDDLLTDCLSATTDDGQGFTVKRKHYSKLMHTLVSIRGKLGDLLLTNGVPVPNLPFWGTNGNIDEFYYANEFEILGVCFQTEVERFLFIFDEHYNFLSDLPRNPELIASPRIQPKARDQPPQQESRTKADERLPSPTTQGNGAGRNAKPGEAAQRMAQSYRHNHPGNRPPTSRMREVLDNIGGMFGNIETD